MSTEARLDKLQHTLFKPQNGIVKASVLILHGMMEHSGRYTAFARYLTGLGYAVMTYDHLGHGYTAKQPSNLGFFQSNNPAEQLVEDAGMMANHMEKLFPLVPHFILGHSMGSFITRCLLQRAGNRFAGAVLVGTGDKIAGTRLGIAFFGLLNWFAPKQRSHIVNHAFNWINNRHFKSDEPSNGTNWLSVDKENRSCFLQDPLCGVDFTNNGFYTLLSLMRRATENGWAKGIPKDLPLLFISGKDDPVGDFGKGVGKVVKALKQDGFANLTMKLYPGMRHEVLNEIDKEQVYQDVSDWLDALVC